MDQERPRSFQLVISNRITLSYNETLEAHPITSVGPVSCFSGEAKARITREITELSQSTVESQARLSATLKLLKSEANADYVRTLRELSAVTSRRTEEKEFMLKPTPCRQTTHHIVQYVRIIQVSIARKGFIKDESEHLRFEIPLELFDINEEIRRRKEPCGAHSTCHLNKEANGSGVNEDPDGKLRRWVESNPDKTALYRFSFVSRCGDFRLNRNAQVMELLLSESARRAFSEYAKSYIGSELSSTGSIESYIAHLNCFAQCMVAGVVTKIKEAEHFIQSQLRKEGGESIAIHPMEKLAMMAKLKLGSANCVQRVMSYYHQKRPALTYWTGEANDVLSSEIGVYAVFLEGGHEIHLGLGAKTNSADPLITILVEPHHVTGISKSRVTTSKEGRTPFEGPPESLVIGSGVTVIGDGRPTALTEFPLESPLESEMSQGDTKKQRG